MSADNGKCCDGGSSKCVNDCQSGGDCSMKTKLSTVAQTNLIQRSCVPLPLPPHVLKELVADARDYALLHGIFFCKIYAVDILYYS